MSLVERFIPAKKQSLFIAAASTISPESYHTFFSVKGVIHSDWSEIAFPSARFKLVGRWDRGEFERADLDGNNSKIGKLDLVCGIGGLKPESIVHSDGRIFLNEELIRQFGEDNQTALEGFCQKLVDDIVKENGGFESSSTV